MQRICYLAPNPGDAPSLATSGDVGIKGIKIEAMANDLILVSTITCPECGYQKTEVMPENACQYFYDCGHCHAVLKPKAGDCCVFCSFGTVKCPPVQRGLSCCP